VEGILCGEVSAKRYVSLSPKRSAGERVRERGDLEFSGEPPLPGPLLPLRWEEREFKRSS